MVDMPATHAKVNPASYSDAMMLTPDADFWWPNAPLQDGGSHNLRTTPDGSYCRYTAQLLDQARGTCYVAISNPRAGLLLAYVFRREDFPGWAIGKNVFTGGQLRGAERRFAGVWNSAQHRLHSLGDRVFPKGRFSTNPHTAGFLRLRRSRFAI